MEELEDVFGVEEVTVSGVLSQITQAGSRWEAVPGKIPRGQGEEHLATMGGIQKARKPISTLQRDSPRPVASRQRHAAPSAGSAPDLLWPRLRSSARWASSAAACIRRRGMPPGRIADALEERTAMAPVAVAERDGAPLPSTPCRSRSHNAVLPSMSVKRKVRSAWEIGHGPLQE